MNAGKDSAYMKQSRRFHVACELEVAVKRRIGDRRTGIAERDYALGA